MGGNFTIRILHVLHLWPEVSPVILYPVETLNKYMKVYEQGCLLDNSVVLEYYTACQPGPG